MKNLILVILLISAPLCAQQSTDLSGWPEERVILFMTSDSDPLVKAFAQESEKSCTGLVALAFSFKGKKSDWSIAWVADDHGRTQVWLENTREAKYVFLGANARKGMASACRIAKGEQSANWRTYPH